VKINPLTENSVAFEHFQALFDNTLRHIPFAAEKINNSLSVLFCTSRCAPLPNKVAQNFLLSALLLSCSPALLLSCSPALR